MPVKLKHMKKFISIIFTIALFSTLANAQNVGIGSSSFTPLNMLDVKGTMVIGTGYAGINTAPADGLLIQGNVGIGTISPWAKLNVVGNFFVDGDWTNDTEIRIREGGSADFGAFFKYGTGDLLTVGTRSSAIDYVAMQISRGSLNTIFNGNVGIGVSPSYRIDIAGQERINAASGTAPIIISTAYAGGANVTNLSADLLDGQHASAFSAASHTHPWNEITSKPAAWLDAANLIQDDANFNNSVPSGFYQYNNAANSPTAGTWYNMINVRHSNTSNDHGFQIAASYYDENIWTRTYQGGTGANNGTYTPWRKLLHTGNIASLYPNINGDNLGNHTATTTLNMNWNHINNVADIYCINNYGQGLVGVYSDVRYQNVWAMGTSWRLAADGTTPGNLYGIAWTHSNIGGQSRPSLSHQMLVMENGITKVALGSGIWTNYGIETGANGTYNRFNTWTELPNATGFYSGINGAHFYPNDASYGSWRILGTRNGWGGIEFPSGDGNISLMIGQGGWGGMTTGMHANNYGWLWRFEHQRLWADGLTDVNDPNYYVDPNGSSRLAYLYHGVGANNIGGWLSGIMQTENTSDGHQYIPLTGNWGYIGTSSQYWYYSYAMSHVDMSQRSLKRDITPLNKQLYELVMNDIDKLKPSLYKFKDETDELESGNEAKFRPNMHMGVVLDESPDYIQDQAFSGIDIYALATMAIAGVKYNREEIKDIKENIGLSEKKMTVSDFGNEELKGNETWISFTNEFINKLSGTSPIITVTPNQTGVWLSVTETTSKGFKVVASGNNSSVTFNWIAMAKVNIEQKEDKTQLISQELIRQLKVDDTKKAMIRDYWKKQTEKNQAGHNQQVEEQKKITNNNNDSKITVPVFPKKENEIDMNLPVNQKSKINEPAEIPKAQEINQQQLKK